MTLSLAKNRRAKLADQMTNGIIPVFTVAVQ